jgi:hypothetical protein
VLVSWLQAHCAGEPVGVGESRARGSGSEALPAALPDMRQRRVVEFYWSATQEFELIPEPDRRILPPRGGSRASLCADFLDLPSG